MLNLPTPNRASVREMEAANAAHAGDGDAFSAQVGLFLLGDPADIPRKALW